MTNSANRDFAATTSWFVQGSIDQDGEAIRISIPCGRIQVGRLPDLQFCISHPSVSKIHAEFVSTDSALFIRDAGSTNGTFVNGKRITEDTVLGENDIVQFAQVEFVVGYTRVEQALRTLVSSPGEWQTSINRFHRLLMDRAIVPHYQSIVQFSDEQIVGYEVLARSSIEGLANPKDLFSTAERAGLAARLSDVCRERGIEFARRLSKPGLLFLNTHPSERPHVGLIESMAKLRAAAPDLKFVLELHEAAVTNPREVAEFRKELKAIDVLLAYDDFGAGQARLMELSEVAPDFLKFDMGLIRDIHQSPQRQQFVAGLVRVVRELGIQPLAEGIETEGESKLCREIGFTHDQGF